MNRKVIIWSIVGGVVVIGGLCSIRPIQKVGIRKRLQAAFEDPASEGAAGGLDKLQTSEMLDIRKFDENNNKATITRVVAREKAQQIWDNYSSWFGSNQTAIVSAFNGLGHIDDASKIAHEFYAYYEEDLLQVLKNALTDKAQYNLLLGKLNKLPKN